MIVAVAVTWEATVPIMANAISTEGDLGCPAKPPFKQLRDRGDPVLHPDIRDLPAMPEKMNIPRRYGIAGKDRLEAVGIGHTCPAHQTAAADDRRADGGHQHHRPKGPARYIITFVFWIRLTE